MTFNWDLGHMNRGVYVRAVKERREQEGDLRWRRIFLDFFDKNLAIKIWSLEQELKSPRLKIRWMNPINKCANDLNRYCSKKYIQMANKYIKKMDGIISHQGNANQIHNEIPLHTPWYWLELRSQIITIGEDGEKSEHAQLVGLENDTATWENSLAVPQLFKHRVPHELAILLLVTYAK